MTESYPGALWCASYELEAASGRAAWSSPEPPSADYPNARVLIRRRGSVLGYLRISGPVSTDAAFTERVRAVAAETWPTEARTAEEPRAHEGRREPAVSVVIATRDRPARVATCLARLSALEYPRLEILVVDNGPSDESTRDVVRRASLGDPRVRYLRESAAGVSRARNRGAAEASGEIVAFVDDDVQVEPDWVRQLVVGFERDPRVAAVTGLVATARLATESEAYFDAANPLWSTRTSHELFGRDLGGRDQLIYPYLAGVFGTGANMAFDRSALLKVGGFDLALGPGTPSFGGEDLDLFLRTILDGGLISYEPSAIVWHHHRDDLESLTEQMRSYGIGWSAYLTKLLTARQTRGPMLRALAGLTPRLVRARLVRREAGSTRLPSAAGSDAGWKAALARVRRAERRGWLVGPPAYARSRWASRKQPTGLTTEAAEPPPIPGVPPSYQPAEIMRIDLDRPLPVLVVAADGSKDPVLVVAQLCGVPIGMAFVDRPASPEELAARLRTELEPALALIAGEHGMAATEGPRPLTSAGLDHPTCAWRARRLELATFGPPISVVLCTRDRPAELELCLQSLIALDYQAFELVVVDNAPTDDATRTVCERFEQKLPIRYVREPQPGLSNARNTGVRHAAYDLIAFLDDDESPEPTWLAETAREFEANERVGVVSGIVLPAELATPAQAQFEQFGGHSKGRGFRRVLFDAAYLRRTQSPLYPLPPFGVGANMAFRRQTLLEIGGFDARLGAGTRTHGSEDTAAFTEAMITGWSMVYTPAAVTWHRHRREGDELQSQLSGYGVGLGAYYTALLLRHPLKLPSLLRLAPRAISDLTRSDSPRNRSLEDLPSELATSTIRSMLRGPYAYVSGPRRKSTTDRFSDAGDK